MDAARASRGAGSEQGALLADSVGLALLVVVEALEPEQRLAFVLHDMFGVPFPDVAAIVGCTPTAAGQLASRARRRVRGAAPVSRADVVCQRVVVEAFVAAASAGDFEALVSLLHPDVVIRADRGTLTVVRRARAVAERALAFSRLADSVHTALVNGLPDVVSRLPGRRPLAVMGRCGRRCAIITKSRDWRAIHCFAAGPCGTRWGVSLAPGFASASPPDKRTAEQIGAGREVLSGAVTYLYPAGRLAGTSRRAPGPAV
jgi:hypothetical protein